MDKKTFRLIAEVIGLCDVEIRRINDNNESLSVNDSTQIIAEIEDRLTDILYNRGRPDNES